MGRKSTGSNPMVLKWAGSPQVPILQYFQIHRSYQNAWSFSISRFTNRKSSFETQDGLFRTDCNLKITNSCDEFVWLTVPEPQNHKFLRWIRVVNSSWTLKSQIPAMNSGGWQMVGPSVFPDSQVENLVLKPKMNFLGLIIIIKSQVPAMNSGGLTIPEP